MLVLLSLTLTFTIWTYSPTYDTNETPILDISIAEKRRIEDVVKPYRLLLSQDEKITGSASSGNIDQVLNLMKSWEIQTVQLQDSEATEEEINEYITSPGRSTFFFTTDVPIKTYSNVLTFANHNLPDAGFDRLVLEWNMPVVGDEIAVTDEMKLYFISTIQRKVYSAVVDKVDKEGFSNRILKPALNFSEYHEIVKEGKLSLFVSNNPIDAVTHTYYLGEVAPERFKDALFNNPSLVRSNPVGTNIQEFTDDSTLMKVDSLTKKLSYVHPASESENSRTPAELIQSSLNFVNEHNGWTDDYRYSRMNPKDQQVDYQLYFQGLPVFSNDTATEITQYWGINRVYRYIRPYYALDTSLSLRKREMQLASGHAVYDILASTPDFDIDSVEELKTGYYLSQSQGNQLNLEPSWYYLLNGTWNRVSPETLGGGNFGLE